MCVFPFGWIGFGCMRLFFDSKYKVAELSYYFTTSNTSNAGDMRQMNLRVCKLNLVVKSNEKLLSYINYKKFSIIYSIKKKFVVHINYKLYYYN